MSRKRRFAVEWSDRFEREARTFGLLEHAREELTAFEEVLSRTPENTQGVPRFQDGYCRPLHTESDSYNVVYSFDGATVSLVTLRRIPPPET